MIRSIVLLRAAVGLCCAVAALGCGPRPSATSVELPDLVLVTFDTLRADHCSVYGYNRPTTPTLDALAAGGVLFERAYAVMPTTAPSHATLFTSLQPDEHGVLRNGAALSQGVTTLAEVLRGAGYETAAFVSSYVVRGSFGMSQGFDHYDDHFEEATSKTRGRERVHDQEVEGAFDRKGEFTTDQVLSWLRGRASSRPLFLWVHYFDPHKPYAPPREKLDLFRASRDVEGRELKIALYDAEVRYADEQLGRLLRGVDEHLAAERTLAVVTADHGEGLGDHDWWTHGVHLYEEAVRVPLIARWPGRLPAGVRVDGSVALIDVMPTLLGLLGLEGSGLRLGGRDLSEAWKGAVEHDGLGPVYLQRRAYSGPIDEDGHEPELDPGTPAARKAVAGPKWALVEGSWKLVHAPEEERAVELYDLARDPREEHDLAAHQPEVVERMLRRLAELRASQEPALRFEDLDPDVRRALESMGYTD